MANPESTPSRGSRGKDFRQPAKKRWWLGDAEGDCHWGQRTMARSQYSPQCMKQWHMGISFKNCSDKHFFSCRKRRDYSLFCLFILAQIKAPWNFCVKGQLKSGTLVAISGELPVVGNTPWSLRAEWMTKHSWVRNQRSELKIWTACLPTPLFP